MTPEQILAAAAKTFAERQKVYGSNYQNVGPALEALFPEGITLENSDDHIRFHLFMLIMVKLSRYAINWSKRGHRDSIHDVSVYAAMLESVDVNDAPVYFHYDPNPGDEEIPVELLKEKIKKVVTEPDKWKNAFYEVFDLLDRMLWDQALGRAREIHVGEKSMSTLDVPGANPANGDTLAMGSWAEHDDGSLIFVESTEGNRVIYSIFDVSKTPIVEYRDAMPQVNFEKQFSKKDWVWHDKTPFPWDRIIKQGAQDRGMRYASADDQLSAAERVAKSLRLRAQNVDARRHRDKVAQRRPSANRARLERMINNLREQLASLPDDELPEDIGVEDDDE